MPAGALPARPFGSWPSPITAELIVAASVGLGGPAFSGGDLWWSELRPAEAGRVQIVRKGLDAAPETARDVLPEGFSARTRVHEYGGGAWWLHDATLFFCNWTDQRLYRIDHAGTDQAGEPVAITPEPADPHAVRYADGTLTPNGRWIICVRESHVERDREARNELVALPADGSSEAVVLVGGPDGPDFVSNPRISPDGTTLAWLQWDHPNMPWDETALWVADLVGNTIQEPELLLGAAGVSIAQPEWDPSGRLWFASDELDGRWQLARVGDTDAAVVPLDEDAEYAQPQWVFGQSWFAFAEGADGPAVVAVARRDGRDHLLDLPYTAYEGVTAGPAGLIGFVAASFTDEPVVVTLDTETGSTTVHRPGRNLGVGPEWWSTPEHISFPTKPGPDRLPVTAHGLFYPPVSPETAGPPGERPPLIVMSHGGPTSAARSQLSLAVQFWTSRGFAVVDVNYRGSTGYGRGFRDALRDQWGIADVDDCIAAARYLAVRGAVDGDRLAIRGGSAGGYTTLCALTFHDDFSVGTSLYGVADLEALAKDTHKFESRYLDGLVGPYPERRDLYVDRSPIHHVDQLATPLLILQGLEDEIVPPAQAEMMAAALRAKGVPFAYIAFEGEQHGFRQAPNIRRALEAELSFYGRMLGFDPADDIEPITIEGA